VEVLEALAMTRDQLVKYIAAIPDLTSHSLEDDHNILVLIHDLHEVAKRVADALMEKGLQYTGQDIIDAYNAGFQEGQRCS
jgi:hypothetical protein